MNDIIIFLKKPHYKESLIEINWKHFFLLILKYYLMMLPVTIVVAIIAKHYNIVHKPSLLPLYKKMLLTLILTPILEELLFRLLLIFNRRNLIVFGLTCFTLSIYYLLINSNIKLLIFAFSTLLFAIAFFNQGNCKLFLRNYFRLIFYATSILFGLLHVFNYTGVSGYLILFVPFLVFPQILMGFFFGYVRVTYGFIYAILFHSFLNLVALIFS
ncbi:MAG: CPBP family intramembrane metalloprotease [Bacteroidales bacterium]|nr:CPBP family intramembrane metalloprotease [Bacteroidales bacterium]